ncbi:Adaptor for signal transduction [Arthrobotrys megalospora]
MSENNDPGSESFESSGSRSVELVDWTVDDVSKFIANLGYPQYCESIEENDITGESLLHLNHRLLQDLNINSVGHRIAIINAIQELKVTHYPLGYGPSVPPSSDATCVPIAEHRNLESILRKRDDTIEAFERELRRSKEEISVAWELLAEEIERGVGVKMELLKSRRLLNGACKDQYTQTDDDFFTLSDSFSLKSGEEIEQLGKENMFGGDSTDDSPDSLYSEIQRALQGPISREGREKFEVFDETTNRPYDPASKMLEVALKRLGVEGGAKDWGMWIQYDGQQRKLENDELPVKVCRELRKEYEDVMFLFKRNDGTKANVGK